MRHRKPVPSRFWVVPMFKVSRTGTGPNRFGSRSNRFSSSHLDLQYPNRSRTTKAKRTNAAKNATRPMYRPFCSNQVWIAGFSVPLLTVVVLVGNVGMVDISGISKMSNNFCGR